MSEQKPIYFTGIRHNRLHLDFPVRPVGDLIRIGDTEFCAADAERVAHTILALTRNRVQPMPHELETER